METQSMNSKTPKHPGKITFVNGTEETVKEASTVPESIRFAEDGGKLVPVVKVVAMTEGDRRIIREYGVDGTLLRSTVQTRNK